MLIQEVQCMEFKHRLPSKLRGQSFEIGFFPRFKLFSQKLDLLFTHGAEIWDVSSQTLSFGIMLILNRLGM
jgi:hypothetical protein